MTNETYYPPMVDYWQRKRFKMTNNPNPNVTAGAALSEYSAQLTAYKQRGETLIRDPLAELQQAREEIATMKMNADTQIIELNKELKLARARIAELEAQLAAHEYNEAEGERFEPEFVRQIKIAQRELFKRIRLVWIDKADRFFFQGIENGKALGRLQGAWSLLESRKRINALRKEIGEARQDLKSESVRCESFAQLARQQSDDLIRLTAERDAFIVKLSLSREQSDSWKTAYLEARDLHEALGQELRQCQRERDELRARLNVVRRAAGDV